MEKIKVGSIVKYTGRLSGEDPVDECKVLEIVEPGDIFNQPMASITKVDCWAAVAELEGYEE